MKADSMLRHPRGPHCTALEIRSILERYRQSGLSLLAFAREHDLCYASLLRWRSKSAAPLAPRPARRRDSRPDHPNPGFVPVHVEAPAVAADFVVTWAPGRSLRIPAGFDPAQLRRLLEALGVRP